MSSDIDWKTVHEGAPKKKKKSPMRRDARMKKRKKVKNHFPKGFLMAGHKKKPAKRKAPTGMGSAGIVVDAAELALLKNLLSHDDEVLGDMVGPHSSAVDLDGLREAVGLERHKKMVPAEPCGSCHAGILINGETLEIMKCDDCKLFEEDTDATEAVGELLKLLNVEYLRGLNGLSSTGGSTVADALDRLEDKLKLASDTLGEEHWPLTESESGE